MHWGHTQTLNTSTVPRAARRCLPPATGMDVARKVTILARECGLQVELAEVPVQSLVPKELWGSRSADEFMEALPQVGTGSGTPEGSCRPILRWGRGSSTADGVTQALAFDPSTCASATKRCAEADCSMSEVHMPAADPVDADSAYSVSILLVLCASTAACPLAAAGRRRHSSAHLTCCSNCLYPSPLAACAV